MTARHDKRVLVFAQADQTLCLLMIFVVDFDLFVTFNHIVILLHSIDRFQLEGDTINLDTDHNK